MQGLNEINVHLDCRSYYLTTCHASAAAAEGQAALLNCWRVLLRLLTANAQQLAETHLSPLWAGLEASLMFAALYPSSQAGPPVTVAGCVARGRWLSDSICFEHKQY